MLLGTLYPPGICKMKYLNLEIVTGTNTDRISTTTMADNKAACLLRQVLEMI